MSATVEKRLLDALEAEAVSHGIDIVDVELAGSGKATTLTVRIDWADESRDTITLDEVGQQSAWISDIVDTIDPVAGSYLLDVSSPGMDRPLRRERDFERFAGEEVCLQTTATEGRRRYTGKLQGMRDGKVVVVCDGVEYEFSLAEIASCKIKPTYDFSGKPGGHTTND